MRGRGRIFEDLKKLHEMLSLRQQGAGLSELGRRYGVDHSTIFYHSRKNGLSTFVTVSGVRAPAGQTPHVTISLSGITVRMSDDGSPMNQGKNYAEYLEEEERRRWAQLLAGGKHRNNGTDKT